MCLEFGSWTCLLNKCSMSERDQEDPLVWLDVILPTVPL